nr:hypothetical protein [Candidatus Sigynarchaeota archaeon]
MMDVILSVVFGGFFCFLISNFTRVGISRRRKGKAVSVVDLVATTMMIAIAGLFMFTALEFEIDFMNPWGILSMYLVILVPVVTVCLSLGTTIIQQARHEPIFNMDARPDIIEQISARKNLPLQDLGRKAWHLALFVLMAIAFFQG